jgi:hypothetical protein
MSGRGEMEFFNELGIDSLWSVMCISDESDMVANLTLSKYDTCASPEAESVATTVTPAFASNEMGLDWGPVYMCIFPDGAGYNMTGYPVADTDFHCIGSWQPYF